MADAYAIVLGFMILFYIITDPLQSNRDNHISPKVEISTHHWLNGVNLVNVHAKGLGLECEQKKNV